MKATELLKSQHEEVSSLFHKIERASSMKDKRRLYQELAHKLVAHDAIEREIFYPACEKEMGLIDPLGEALVEHGLVEFSLFVAGQGMQKSDFDHRITVLKEVVEHHVKEEERVLLPQAERALGADMLEQLGERMEKRFEVVEAGEFAEPLRDQLNQVLAGALETKPSKSKLAKRAQSRVGNGGRSASPR
jgi:hypothetical protein